MNFSRYYRGAFDPNIILYTYGKKTDPRKSGVDDETENISPHSQKGRNCVHNTGFTLTGVLISVHETGLGVFSVSTKWDWGQILCPHLWVHYNVQRGQTGQGEGSKP